MLQECYYILTKAVIELLHLNKNLHQVVALVFFIYVLTFNTVVNVIIYILYIHTT